MRLAHFCFAVAFIPAWLPLRPGDKWIYDHETRDATGIPKKVEINRWKTEETIVGSWTVPEGTLVGRQVRVGERLIGVALVLPRRRRTGRL